MLLIVSMCLPIFHLLLNQSKSPQAYKYVSQIAHFKTKRIKEVNMVDLPVYVQIAVAKQLRLNGPCALFANSATTRDHDVTHLRAVQCCQLRSFPAELG